MVQIIDFQRMRRERAGRRAAQQQVEDLSPAERMLAELEERLATDAGFAPTVISALAALIYQLDHRLCCPQKFFLCYEEGKEWVYFTLDCRPDDLVHLAEHMRESPD